MDFTFAELKEYLDKRFDEQDTKLDAKLDERFDAFEDKMMSEFGKLRQEMHNGFAAVAETIAAGHDYNDKRFTNHERRLTRLDNKAA